MNILITVKQAGKRRDRVAALPFPLEHTPDTLRSLIHESAHACVKQYNERVRRSESASPLSDAQMDAMSETGKFAFGINYSKKEADETEAIQTAIQGFEDGLFRIFRFDQELTELDAPLTLHENDHLTFIRLTMLTGSLF